MRFARVVHHIWTTYVLDRRNFRPPWQCPVIMWLCAASIYVSISTNYADHGMSSWKTGQFNICRVELVGDGTAVFIPIDPWQQIKRGELWRLITPCLIHLSRHHLITNLLVLYLFGGQVEWRLGSARFALLFFLPIAVFTDIASVSIAKMETFGGISGVTWAIVGYLALIRWFAPWKELYSFKLAAFLYFGRDFRDMLSVEFDPVWLESLPGKPNNAAHFTGFVLALLFGAWSLVRPVGHPGAETAAHPIDVRQKRQPAWRKAAGGVVLAGAFLFLMAIPNPSLSYERGLKWYEQKEFDKALVEFTEAIHLEPKYAAAYNMRANTWKDKTDYDKAIADFNEAIRLDPKNVAGLVNRGNAWKSKGAYDKALNDFSEAVRFDPNSVIASNNRAWLWATCPDSKYRHGKNAIESATKACERTQWKNGNLIDTLAAAYAEAGDFQNAVEWQTKAIEMAVEKERPDLQSRLDLYKSNKPYREELRSH